MTVIFKPVISWSGAIPAAPGDYRVEAFITEKGNVRIEDMSREELVAGIQYFAGRMQADREKLYADATTPKSTKYRKPEQGE